MAKNPYEWLYERQSQPLKAYVLDEVAKVLARAVEQFPPPIESWERDDLRLKYEPVLAQVRGRPSLACVQMALRLYRWELERDVEAIDRYMRGEHWRELELSALEVETALFLSQYWVDQTLAFKDYAQEKFKFRELLGLADRLDDTLVRQASSLRTRPE